VESLRYNTTGGNNTAIGNGSLKVNTTSGQNTAIGDNSLRSFTAAGTSYNTAVGWHSGFNTTSGYNMTLIGHSAGAGNTTGSGLVAVGSNALAASTTGTQLVAVGNQALLTNTTGSFNTAIGDIAMRLNTTGSNNTASGYNALAANTTGANNTALGYAAGENITTGSSNIIIGKDITAPSATASNQLNIGNTIYGDLSNDNVGLYNAPNSDLHTSYNHLQLGPAAAIATNKVFGHTTIHNNSRYSSTGDKYMYSTHHACKFTQSYLGKFEFQVAPVGTADAAITWTTAMTIANSGDVDIGTYSVTGSTAGIRIENNNSEFVYRTSANTTDGRILVDFYNPNGRVGFIRTSGTSTSYVTSSDYRLKENVVPMTGSIDRLKALKPSRFNFKADTDTTLDGFLAHEAQAVVPECATGTKDAMMDEEYEVTPAVMDGETVVTEAVMGTRSVPDYQGIDQAKLVPLLVSALQEAIARIEVLENA
jgi:hypothetical protein